MGGFSRIPIFPHSLCLYTPVGFKLSTRGFLHVPLTPSVPPAQVNSPRQRITANRPPMTIENGPSPGYTRKLQYGLQYGRYGESCYANDTAPGVPL